MELLRAFDLAIKKLETSHAEEEKQAAHVLDTFRAAVVKSMKIRALQKAAKSEAQTIVTTGP